MQTMIHQRLVRSEALVEASSVLVKCIHGDVHEYPLVPIEISCGGKKHSVKAAVSSSLTHPLILGLDWAGFPQAVRGTMRVRARPVGTCKSCAMFCAEAGAGNAAQGSGEAGDPQPEVPAPMFPPAVPLTQVMVIDGSKVRPDAALTYPHFIVVRDRLYRSCHQE